MEQIIRRLRRKCPKTREGIEKRLGMSLIPVAQGSFRSAYRIGFYPMIVKIPRHPSGVKHSAREAQMVKRLKKHVPSLMPVMLFFSKRAGIVIQKEYKTENVTEAHVDIVERTLRKKKLPLGDLHTANLALEGTQIKVIDLGCFR